jgi:hypothetical protein
MPRTRRGREFWKTLVNEFDGAGTKEAHQAFADRHGVRCDTFRRWLYLLRSEKRGRRWRARKPSPPKRSISWPLVEVQAMHVADERIELELREGTRVRIPATFDVEALRRVLAIFDDKPLP